MIFKKKLTSLPERDGCDIDITTYVTQKYFIGILFFRKFIPPGIKKAPNPK